MLSELIVGFYSENPESETAPVRCTRNLKRSLPCETRWVSSKDEGEGCDVVHWHSLMDKTIPYMWDVPTVLTYHGDVQWTEPRLNYGDSPLIKSLKERLADLGKIWQFDHVIFVSESVSREMNRRLGWMISDSQVVYNGIDDHFTETRDGAVLSKYGIEKPYAFHLSAYSKRKNPERLREVWEWIEEDTDLNPVVAGSGWHNQWDIGWVDEEDLPALYSEALVFLFPSLHECFGLPPYESIACGTVPVVGSVHALTENIGEYSVMCDPKSVESIKDSLSIALEERIEPTQLTDWKTNAEETMEIYGELT